MAVDRRYRTCPAALGWTAQINRHFRDPPPVPQDPRFFEASSPPRRLLVIRQRATRAFGRSRGRGCLDRAWPAARYPRDLPRRARSARAQAGTCLCLCLHRREAVPSIYSIVPPNDGSALRHGHHFEPVDFVIDHGRGHHDAYSAGSCQRIYARACGCRQRPRCHREELIESERGWSGREAFVTMMQTADLGQGNDRSGPGRLNGSSIRCVLAERQVGP